VIDQFLAVAGPGVGLGSEVAGVLPAALPLGGGGAGSHLEGRVMALFPDRPDRDFPDEGSRKARPHDGQGGVMGSLHDGTVVLVQDQQRSGEPARRKRIPQEEKRSGEGCLPQKSGRGGAIAPFARNGARSEKGPLLWAVQRGWDAYWLVPASFGIVLVVLGVMVAVALAAWCWQLPGPWRLPVATGLSVAPVSAILVADRRRWLVEAARAAGIFAMAARRGSGTVWCRDRGRGRRRVGRSW